MLLLHSIDTALEQTATLALFLTAAIWLAALAAQSGLAERAAGLLARLACGRRVRLYALTCAACALLTSTVSLDGAIVLMVPLVLALAREERELLRPLLLGVVVVANAFSLAVPQGNPTNLVVMSRLGLSPESFVLNLFTPALLATSVCVAALAIGERASLRGGFATTRSCAGQLSTDERLAAAALASAAIAGALAPWLGIPPWWTLAGVAAATLAAARVRRGAVPPLAVPWRLCAWIGALLVLVDVLAVPRPAALLGASSPIALVAVSLGAAALSNVANNLPASVAVAGLLGPRALPAYAALAGLSVGALATRHGSVATTIAFDRAGPEARLGSRRYLGLMAPAALAATAGAAISLWLVSG
jgi:arsenical pump membrane protein